MFDNRTLRASKVNQSGQQRRLIMAQRQEIPSGGQAWPREGLTRVPYRVFQTEEAYKSEQKLIFQGPSWHYLALEVEVPEPGDFRTTKVGDTPVIVTRDADGEIYAFENRCAHRGALICLDNQGKGKKDFSCVYHAWTYDRQGNLKGVAFKDGVNGKGGMPDSFRMEDMARANCGSPRCMVLSSDRSRNRFPRSKNISGRKFHRASNACWVVESRLSSAASRRCCPTTGSSTWRTSRTPTMPAFCTCSSRRSS